MNFVFLAFIAPLLSSGLQHVCGKKRYWHKKEARKRSISPTKPRKTSKSKLGVTVKGVPQFSDIDASDGEDYAPPKDLSPRSAAEYVKKKLKEDAARRKKRRRKKKLSEGMKYSFVK